MILNGLNKHFYFNFFYFKKKLGDLFMPV